MPNSHQPSPESCVGGGVGAADGEPAVGDGVGVAVGETEVGVGSGAVSVAVAVAVAVSVDVIVTVGAGVRVGSVGHAVGRGGSEIDGSAVRSGIGNVPQPVVASNPARSRVAASWAELNGRTDHPDR